ncbi:MAG: hypothetical protein AVDCRST_MAG66-3326, partial [uncultured Pseudonocardia sp.]
ARQRRPRPRPARPRPRGRRHRRGGPPGRPARLGAARRAA